MIYAFIAGHCSDLPVVACARVMKVSVSGFYEWRQRQANPCRRHREDAQLTKTITEIWRQSRGTYGSPRVWDELTLGQGMSVSRKRVERLMRQAGIEGVYRRRRRHGTTRRHPEAIPSDDLIKRQFHPSGADRLWVADITEHPTREGKVYVAVVLDAWSRRVIGWSIADHLRTELVVDALDMACWRRKPAPNSGLIHHADHGTQNLMDGLRTPLTAVLAYSELISQDETTPEPIRGWVAVVVDEARAMAATIEDFTVVSRLANHLLTLSPTTFPVVTEIQRTLTSIPTSAISPQIMRSADIQVHTDPERLRQLLRILITNALQHASGGVEVSVDAHLDNAWIEVRDDGPGLPQHTKSLFEASWQPHATQANPNTSAGV